MGFISDNSQDEHIKFERFKKFQRNEQQLTHGDEPFALKRKLKPFEKLLIEKLGGREIIEQYLDKNIRDDIDELELHDWVDPTSPLENYGQFLLVSTDRAFENIYNQELSIQQ